MGLPLRWHGEAFSRDSHIYHRQKGKVPEESAWQIDDQEVAKGGETMKIKNVALNLSKEETLRLTRIFLDDDKEETLLFLKECLKPQLDQATRDH